MDGSGIDCGTEQREPGAGRPTGDMERDLSMSAGAPALMALSIAYPFVRAGRYAIWSIQ